MDVVHLSAPVAPAWLSPWIGGDPANAREKTLDLSSGGVLRYALSLSEHFTLIQLTAPNANELDGPGFAQRVIDTYRTAAELLSDCGAGYPVRWWNYLPEIRRRTEHGLDWYMHFNAGRYAALAEGRGEDQPDDDLGSMLATASAVGHDGPDFIVHMLAARHRGTALENPRQVPAYHYSSEYGPKPPCFARATGIDRTGDNEIDCRVLIGGTASVVDQRSVHLDDLSAQFDETCRNLGSLLANGRGEYQPADHPARDNPYLDLISQMRVYVVRPADTQWIVQAIEQRFGHLERLEVMQVPLCRPDLLVEIEGITQAEPQFGVSRGQTSKAWQLPHRPVAQAGGGV